MKSVMSKLFQRKVVVSVALALLLAVTGICLGAGNIDKAYSADTAQQSTRISSVTVSLPELLRLIRSR